MKFKNRLFALLLYVLNTITIIYGIVFMHEHLIAGRYYFVVLVILLFTYIRLSSIRRYHDFPYRVGIWCMDFACSICLINALYHIIRMVLIP